MRFGCALFIAAVIGAACAIIAALTSLVWHSHDRDLHEKNVLSNWRRLKRAKPVR